MDARAGREKVGSVQRMRINQSERLATESGLLKKEKIDSNIPVKE